jgi:phage baseplate assembly protein gpV
LTAAELAAELAGGAGLEVEAASDGPRYRHLIQHGQSDLELLIQVTERCGLHATVRADTLHLITLEGIGEEIPLALGDALHEARVELNGEPACRSVSVSGWDPQLVEVHQLSASSPRSGRDVAAEVPPDIVGGSGHIAFADEPAEGGEHAEGLAQAELDVRAAREVSLWGVAEGDPRLRPGAPIRVAGVDEVVAGTYVLTSATHVVDERQGYLTEFSTLPPRLSPRPRGAIAALGEVTSVDDPEGTGRVRVSLPAYGDVETDWMSVVAAGAGSAKGLVMLPDVGDSVLLLFAHEDPSWGVVVGGLFGAEGAPDAGVADGAVCRYNLFTSGGHRLTLDDEQRSIRLQTSAESYLELTPELVVLHSAQPLTLEAPGQPIVIRGRSVEFETAEGVE